LASGIRSSEIWVEVQCTCGGIVQVCLGGWTVPPAGPSAEWTCPHCRVRYDLPVTATVAAVVSLDEATGTDSDERRASGTAASMLPDPAAALCEAVQHQIGELRTTLKRAHKIKRSRQG